MNDYNKIFSMLDDGYKLTIIQNQIAAEVFIGLEITGKPVEMYVSRDCLLCDSKKI